LLGHARTRGSGARNPRSEAEHRSRLRAFTFCANEVKTALPCAGPCRYWPVGRKSRWTTMLWLMTLLGSAGPPRNPVRFPCSQSQKPNPAGVASADAWAALASTLRVRRGQPRRSGCSISVEGAVRPPIWTSETARRRRSRRGADQDGPGYPRRFWGHQD